MASCAHNAIELATYLARGFVLVYEPIYIYISWGGRGGFTYLQPLDHLSSFVGCHTLGFYEA